MRVPSTWAELVHELYVGASILYKAPMDRAPMWLPVTRKYRNGKIRVQGPECQYTFDDGHWDRVKGMRTSNGFVVFEGK